VAENVLGGMLLLVTPSSIAIQDALDRVTHFANWRFCEMPDITTLSLYDIDDRDIINKASIMKLSPGGWVKGRPVKYRVV
jgi:hypothetical protein